MVASNDFVVLGDVVASRDIPDRSAFRQDLLAGLERVNDRHADALVAPFEPIKGIDEFGGVLARLAPLGDILEELLNTIHPTRIRVAVTRGEIDVGDPEAGVASMDGPAFHRADRLTEEIEADDLYVGVETDTPADPLLESALNLLFLLRADRTDRQIEVLEAYERHGTQTAAAAELDLTHQAVSDTLRRIDYHRITAIRERIRHACEELYV